jgi:rhodanese-related sulfurtransferase
MNASDFFTLKLQYETDPADVAQELGKGTILVIDARTAEHYERGHVPGAINFPHRTMNEESVRRLPQDALLVTYCDGIGCNASTKAAQKLAGFGFRVKEMLGGLDWWMRDGLPVEAPHPASGQPLPATRGEGLGVRGACGC